MPKLTTWKYAAELASIVDCPPKKQRAPMARRCFRVVHSDITHRNNFLPVALIPGRNAVPGAKPCCTEFSLSLFENREKAESRLRYFKEMRPEFVKRAGNCLAEIQLLTTHGESLPVSKSTSHFELFEYADADLAASVIGVHEIVSLGEGESCNN